MSDSLTISILAKRGGVNVETIRYYQRRSLSWKSRRSRMEAFDVIQKNR
jgi:DNA-binding transcriptional MerR regulator